MEITAHGWNRNMGETQLVNIDVSELSLSKDENKNITWQKPGLFASSRHGAFFGVEIHLTKEIKMTGSYRLKVKLTRSDILCLFRTVFGDELKVSLIEEHGFTVSAELTKAMLKTVKLTDLTLGELMDMNKQSAKGAAPSAGPEKAIETVERKPTLSGLRRLEQD
jgi:hypothetical protein